MHLSLQEASSTFNCAAFAAQAEGSLNRRWTIVRPYICWKLYLWDMAGWGVGPVVGHPQHADCSTNNAAVANDCCVYSCSRVVVQLPNQVLSPHRMSILSMLHSRMDDLMIISFERDIAGKIKSDRGLLRRIWNSGPEGRRQLQLYYRLRWN
jgi:hypothetical protein